MTLTIKTFEAGPIQTNAYLVGDEAGAGGRAIVIDAPYGVSEEVTSAAAKAGWQIELIVITHTHWDHIADAAALVAATGAPLLAHAEAAAALAEPRSLVGPLPFAIPPVALDRPVTDGDTITFGEHRFQVMYLPGHDPLHIALYNEADRVLFGGDVLFPNGHGRLDLPGGDAQAMRHSLVRLAALPADVTVYPGHGRPTTIGAESWLPRG